MTRKQAAALLGISTRTFSRRLADGIYKGSRTGEGQFSEVSFSYADLGLVEPSVAKLATHPDVRVAAQYEDAAPDAPVREFRTRPAPEATNPNLGLHPDDDLTFAEAYRKGLATDTAGNTIHGDNERWPTKGLISLLGPQDPKPKVRPDTTAHMDPRLIGTSHTTIGTDGEPVRDAGSANHPLNKNSKEAPVKQPHPNQSRNELLSAIWADIRRGYSR